jgi:hypothetical protein
MDRGNLVVSASGKGHQAIINRWVIHVVIVLVFVCLWCFLFQKYGYDKWRDSGENLNFLWVSALVVGVVACLGNAYLVQTRISNTVINVYENSLEGAGLTPRSSILFLVFLIVPALFVILHVMRFFMPFFISKLICFQLTCDEIIDVDVEKGNTIIIRANTIKHKIKIYAMNANEIMDAILSMKE